MPFEDYRDYNPEYEKDKQAINHALNINAQAENILLASDPEDELERVPKNSSWAPLSFVVPVESSGTPRLDSIDLSNRRFSSASLKYTDSSFGGNTCINPPAQFTRYSDIPDPGFRSHTTELGLGFAGGRIGMGRYYSEAIDDNKQEIHLTFGVPEFNSLVQFFTGFYSPEQARIARSGRLSDGLVNEVLNTTGTVIGLAIAPLFLIPFAITLVGLAARVVMGKSPSKFYTLKPSMHNYWIAATGILNHMGVNKGVVYPEAFGKKKDSDTEGGESGATTAQEEVENIFNKILPKEIMSDGVINLIGMASNSKQLQMEFEKNLAKAVEASDGEVEEAVFKALNNQSLLRHGNSNRPVTQFSLEHYLKSIFDSNSKENEFSGGGDQYRDDGTTMEAATGTLTTEEYINKVPNRTFFDQWIGIEADAARWATFRVDYTGTVSESFSNSVTEISTASMFNGVSKAVKNVQTSLAGGNIAEVITPFVDGVKQVVEGALDTVQLGGLLAVAGDSFVDIPKIWEDSQVSLPKSTYTITLTSPYGNPISQLFSIYAPLAMLLAGALPLAAGKHAYRSPFLCQIHDRGRMLTRLGIIDSLSITRGTSNLGFANDGRCMAMEVSFSVLDLSSIMSVPIKSPFAGNIFSDLGELVDGESALTDYLGAITGLSLTDTAYIFPKLRRHVRKIKANYDVAFSSTTLASYVGTNLGVGAINAIMRGTDKK